MVFDLNSLFQGGISVAALVTVGLGAFKLGSRQWERLYRAKSTELEEIKKNPMAVDPMAAARRVMESTTKTLSATIARLTAERITIEQELEEKDDRLKDLTSQQGISDDRLSYIQEQREKTEEKLVEYDTTLKNLLKRRNVAHAVIQSIDSGDLVPDDLPSIDSDLRARLQMIDKPGPAAAKFAGAILQKDRTLSAKRVAKAVQAADEREQAIRIAAARGLAGAARPVRQD